MRPAAALLFLAVVACDSPTAPPASTEPVVAGVYELAGVNGKACPCTVAAIPPEVIRWRRGSLTLKDDLTFVDSLFGEIDPSPFGLVVRDSSAVTGTYSINGNLLVLKPDDRAPYVLARDGDELARFVSRQQISAVLLDLTLTYRR